MTPESAREESRKEVTMNCEKLQDYGKEMEQILRLKTFPFGVKMLEDESQIPGGAYRPLQDDGKRLALCQAFALSRRNGMTVAMLKQDMWCYEPVIGLGMVEAPKIFQDGYPSHPLYTRTPEAGKRSVSKFPRFPVGKYVGVVSAPLREISFMPDAVVIYCDPSQLTFLLAGHQYPNGEKIQCTLSPGAVCIFSIVPVILEGKCKVATPCSGDRMAALAGDDELAFGAPIAALDDLMLGLRYISESSSKFPRALEMKPEAFFPDEYAEMREMVGIKDN